MLFDLGPKDRKEELFGRNDEVSEMLRLITTGNWIVVLGPRMTGKTSLVKVALAELQKTKKYETVYLNLRGTRSVRGLLDGLAESINANRKAVDRLKNYISNVKSIHIGPDGLTIERDSPSTTTSTLLSLFAALDRSGKKYVISLDEVQVLSPVSGQFLALLANVFTSYPSIKFVFTGSQIGLIRTLLRPPDPHSPLYGRPPADIRLKPFPKETSEAFILAGLKQCSGVTPLARDQLSEATSRLDGIAGWLTMFGNFYGVRRLEYEKALKRTIEEGSKIARSELDNLLKGRSRSNYLAVLRTIKSHGSLGSSWSEAKSGAEAKLKRDLNNKTISDTLDSLVEAELLENRDGRYRIVDPLLEESL